MPRLEIDGAARPVPAGRPIARCVSLSSTNGRGARSESIELEEFGRRRCRRRIEAGPDLVSYEPSICSPRPREIFPWIGYGPQANGGPLLASARFSCLQDPAACWVSSTRLVCYPACKILDAPCCGIYVRDFRQQDRHDHMIRSFTLIPQDPSKQRLASLLLGLYCHDGLCQDLLKKNR